MVDDYLIRDAGVYVAASIAAGGTMCGRLVCALLERLEAESSITNEQANIATLAVGENIDLHHRLDAVRRCHRGDGPAHPGCAICGALDCPHAEPLHYHGDGCPACITHGGV